MYLTVEEGQRRDGREVYIIINAIKTGEVRMAGRKIRGRKKAL